MEFSHQPEACHYTSQVSGATVYKEGTAAHMIIVPPSPHRAKATLMASFRIQKHQMLQNKISGNELPMFLLSY